VSSRSPISLTAVLRFQGGIWIGLGAAMLVSALPGLYFRDGGMAGLVGVGAFTGLIGISIVLGVRRTHEIRTREALLAVSGVWISAGLICALPYYLAGVLTFPDAVFETISGFTTTGASVVSDLEVWPHALLFWRSMTHCLGGMGIVVMALAVLPILGYGGVELFQTESVGPVRDKLTPRIAETARILWGIYVGLIGIETLLLMAGGMTFFDALCHSFGTLATGGFSTRNASLGYYQSSFINWVVIVFMILGGANFALHYRALFAGRPGLYWKDDQFRYWILTILAAVSIILLANHILASSAIATFDESVFAVISTITTTGYVISDYERWGYGPQFLLIMLFFVGGCAGSTAGSIKSFRWVTIVKALRLQMRSQLHPQAILTLRMNDRIVESDTVKGVVLFTVIYFLQFAVSALLLMFMNVDIISALTAVAACLGSVGPGFGAVGPTETYAALPVAAKMLLALNMLLGRLELYAFLVIFTRGFWRP